MLIDDRNLRALSERIRDVERYPLELIVIPPTRAPHRLSVDPQFHASRAIKTAAADQETDERLCDLELGRDQLPGDLVRVGVRLVSNGDDVG